MNRTTDSETLMAAQIEMLESSRDDTWLNSG